MFADFSVPRSYFDLSFGEILCPVWLSGGFQFVVPNTFLSLTMCCHGGMCGHMIYLLIVHFVYCLILLLPMSFVRWFLGCFINIHSYFCLYVRIFVMV